MSSSIPSGRSRDDKADKASMVVRISFIIRALKPHWSCTEAAVYLFDNLQFCCTYLCIRPTDGGEAWRKGMSVGKREKEKGKRDGVDTCGQTHGQIHRPTGQRRDIPT